MMEFDLYLQNVAQFSCSVDVDKNVRVFRSPRNLNLNH
jgi:hypothetical protein